MYERIFTDAIIDSQQICLSHVLPHPIEQSDRIRISHTEISTYSKMCTCLRVMPVMHRTPEKPQKASSNKQ